MLNNKYKFIILTITLMMVFGSGLIGFGFGSSGNNKNKNDSTSFIVNSEIMPSIGTYNLSIEDEVNVSVMTGQNMENAPDTTFWLRFIYLSQAHNYTLDVIILPLYPFPSGLADLNSSLQLREKVADLNDDSLKDFVYNNGGYLLRYNLTFDLTGKFMEIDLSTFIFSSGYYAVLFKISDNIIGPIFRPVFANNGQFNTIIDNNNIRFHLSPDYPHILLDYFYPEDNLQLAVNFSESNFDISYIYMGKLLLHKSDDPSFEKEIAFLMNPFVARSLMQANSSIMKLSIPANLYDGEYIAVAEFYYFVRDLNNITRTYMVSTTPNKVVIYSNRYYTYLTAGAMFLSYMITSWQTHKLTAQSRSKYVLTLLDAKYDVLSKVKSKLAKSKNSDTNNDKNLTKTAKTKTAKKRKPQQQ